MHKKGKWFKKETFYSICSKHQEPEHFCDLCNIGHWENNIAHAIGSFFHKWAYPLWKVWRNSPKQKLKFTSRWK